MKCPFELPVRKALTHVNEAGVKYQVQITEGKRALAAYLTKDEADYIVQAINSYEKLINVCRNASTSLAITMLPKLDNSVASNDDIIKVVILSLEQALKEAENPK